MTCKKYIVLVTSVLVTIMSLIGLMCFLVDPYNYFGLNKWGVYISCEREFKSQQIHRYPHNALLVGNSRAAMINVSGLKGYTFFNGAFGGAKLHEIYHFLERHLTSEKIVFLPLTLGENDDNSAINDFFSENKILQITKYLFNSKGVEFSIKTLIKHVQKEPSGLGVDGSGNQIRWQAHNDIDNPGIFNEGVKNVITSMKNFRFCNNNLMYLEKIRDLLAARNVQLVVYFDPICEPIIKEVKGSPSYDEFIKWKGAIKEMFPNLIDLSESSYGKKENFFKIDPVHFRSETGVAFMNKEIIPTI